MRVSERYKLGMTQSQLDFVDVDTWTDVPVFIDPRALLLFDTEWANDSVALVKHFFGVVLEAIRRGERSRADRLLTTLREPNETHLGLSRGRSAGRAIGPDKAVRIRAALERSEAVQTGLLTDLEDTILMIEGIGPDLISDITTNVIRGPLVRYTQDQAAQHGIAVETVYVGPMWDPEAEDWQQLHVQVPRPARPLLLVPKALVRMRMDYDDDEYYSDYLIPFLIDAEIEAGSSLVRVLKDGRQRVDIKDIKEKYGTGKAAIERITREHPQLLDKYREAKARVHPPLNHLALAQVTNSPEPDWDALLARVTRVRAGNAGASAFHNAVEALLSALLYPALNMPHKEVEIHEGRKRIDIVYANSAGRGFFDWLKSHYRAPYVFVECKNYEGDPTNPELDQLAGRFSSHRGQFGMLVARRFKDKDLFIRRCRDTAIDDRGYIVPLDDDDLTALVEARKQGDTEADLLLLRERFNALIF